MDLNTITPEMITTSTDADWLREVAAVANRADDYTRALAASKRLETIDAYVGEEEPEIAPEPFRAVAIDVGLGEDSYGRASKLTDEEMRSWLSTSPDPAAVARVTASLRGKVLIYQRRGVIEKAERWQAILDRWEVAKALVSAVEAAKTAPKPWAPPDDARAIFLRHTGLTAPGALSNEHAQTRALADITTAEQARAIARETQALADAVRRHDDRMRAWLLPWVGRLEVRGDDLEDAEAGEYLLDDDNDDEPSPGPATAEGLCVWGDGKPAQAPSRVLCADHFAGLGQKMEDIGTAFDRKRAAMDDDCDDANGDGTEDADFPVKDLDADDEDTAGACDDEGAQPGCEDHDDPTCPECVEAGLFNHKDDDCDDTGDDGGAEAKADPLSDRQRWLLPRLLGPSSVSSVALAHIGFPQWDDTGEAVEDDALLLRLAIADETAGKARASLLHRLRAKLDLLGGPRALPRTKNTPEPATVPRGWEWAPPVSVDDRETGQQEGPSVDDSDDDSTEIEAWTEQITEGVPPLGAEAPEVFCGPPDSSVYLVSLGREPMDVFTLDAEALTDLAASLTDEQRRTLGGLIEARFLFLYDKPAAQDPQTQSRRAILGQWRTICETISRPIDCDGGVADACGPLRDPTPPPEILEIAKTITPQHFGEEHGYTRGEVMTYRQAWELGVSEAVMLEDCTRPGGTYLKGSLPEPACNFPMDGTEPHADAWVLELAPIGTGGFRDWNRKPRGAEQMTENVPEKITPLQASAFLSRLSPKHQVAVVAGYLSSDGQEKYDAARMGGIDRARGVPRHLSPYTDPGLMSAWLTEWDACDADMRSDDKDSMVWVPFLGDATTVRTVQQVDGQGLPPCVEEDPTLAAIAAALGVDDLRGPGLVEVARIVGEIGKVAAQMTNSGTIEALAKMTEELVTLNEIAAALDVDTPSPAKAILTEVRRLVACENERDALLNAIGADTVAEALGRIGRWKREGDHPVAAQRIPGTCPDCGGDTRVTIDYGPERLHQMEQHNRPDGSPCGRLTFTDPRRHAHEEARREADTPEALIAQAADLAAAQGRVEFADGLRAIVGPQPCPGDDDDAGTQTTRALQVAHEVALYESKPWTVKALATLIENGEVGAKSFLTVAAERDEARREVEGLRGDVRAAESAYHRAMAQLAEAESCVGIPAEVIAVTSDPPTVTIRTRPPVDVARALGGRLGVLGAVSVMPVDID